MKLAFQEDTIEQLNKALIAQQEQILQLEFKMKHVTNKLKELSVTNLASQNEETPPPHY